MGANYFVEWEEEARNPVQILYAGLDKQTGLGMQIGNLCDQVLRREKLELSVRVLARLIRAVVGGRREMIAQSPGVKALELAVQLLLRNSAKNAKKAMSAGKLRGLGAMQRQGIVWVSGRIRGDDMVNLVGTAHLPVVLPSDPLAYSVMSKSHREDHRRGAKDIAARSRRMVWVTQATRVAKKVAQRCFACRNQDKRLERQLMGRLPPERTEQLAPFEAVALDLFGHFMVKDPAKGRRSFKCWVIAYVCMAVKAVCLLACPGYDTAVFLSAHHLFCGIFGRPKLVYTDHAPSLVKAKETQDWGEIADQVGRQGTEWRLTPKGCSWRNGLAERVIRAARHSLAHALTLGETLDFHEFASVLAVVSSIVNARPLSVRLSPEGEFHTLAPRDLLFGRAGRSARSVEGALDFVLDQEEDAAIESLREHQVKIVKAWRQKWLSTVFPEMVSRPKWRSSYRNLQVGDVGHVRYPREVGEDVWRIARVIRADADDDDVVRTVAVEFRPRHKADRNKAYRSKVNQQLVVGAQRFAVLLAIEEQNAQGTVESLDPDTSEMTLN